MFTLLLVEDDKNTRKLICDILSDDGYKVLEAQNGKQAIAQIEQHHIDLMLIDIMMPEMDGLELTKYVRKYDKNMPMLMVTAKSEPKDKHAGFIVGIDDYIVKPVDDVELLLRIKALLRRAQIVHEQRIIIGDAVIDYTTFTVTRFNERIVLPKKEFLLLYKLLSYPNIIFTRDKLLDEIWGFDNESDDTTINVHISKLRSKFRHFDEFELLSVRGLGYKAVRNYE